MKKRQPASSSARAVQRLRQRLREAEETLQAIRLGNVDALVVDSPDGEQLFTLRSADQPYRLMVEQMREGAITLSAAGTILYCNECFGEMLGARAQDLIAHNIADYLSADDRQKCQAMLAADSYRASVSLLRADSEPVPAQISSNSLIIDGDRTIAVVIGDLTHEQIERSLRESNRMKDEFLATLSHELRTPLNVILGWTRMLMGDQLPEATRRRALRLIDRNAEAQAQLVNDLVDMSRMATGKLALNLEAVPLVPALETAMESVRPAAEAKQLKLLAKWGSLPATVNADATRLQQVLWNLLSNAIKFTPAGGTVSLAAEPARGKVRITVTDSGIGIERAFLPHVFDRFRQADSGMTRAYGGLGLGLSIVRDLVALQGGHVEVESEGLGRGSTFAVTLDTSTAGGPEERRSRSRRATSLAGYRILVLEDHDDTRELIYVALENAGAAVVAFDRSEPALEAMATIRPSLIVADIGLPDEDGYAFIRRVRRHASAGLRSVPAIAVTAYATDADRESAIAAGFQRHFAKPVDPAILIDAIHQLVRRGRRG